MVYHGKQWYTMVQCNCTMVQITCTMVDYGIPWYILTVPWHILVQPWFTELVPWCIMTYHGTTLHKVPQYNLLVTWHAMEYDGTFSYYHGTKFLHHGILWFTMVHPLLKYTIDYSIVCQNVGYHSTVYHAFIIVYFVLFTF